MTKPLALFPLLFLALPSIAVPPAPHPTTIPVSGPSGEVNVLAMGDWGAATPGQKQVAQTMAAYAQKQGHIQAVLLAGDNFYVKLASIDDPAWKNVFEDVYDARRLNVPFFAALGNHDYEQEKAAIEIEHTEKYPNSRWRLPARWYRVNFPSNDKPLLTVLMIDSNKGKFTPEEWAAQTAWIDEQLASVPDSTWKVCVCHHPPFSNGAHGDIGPLQTDWGPVLEKRHLDLFIAGHDHDLQHLEIPDWHESFVLVGGGGASTRPMLRDNRGPFSKSTQGFGHFQFTPEKLTARIISREGELLHSFERTRSGEVKILSSVPSDKATTKPLKTVQGIEDKKKNDD
jgi:hypothetical protein